MDDAYLTARMKHLGVLRTRKALALGDDLISGELLIALAIRESGLRNVLGDYSADKKRAHARGAFQIHDRYHSEFLRSVPGCVAARWIPEATRANWIPVKGTHAMMRWMCPTWEDGARYAQEILTGFVKIARAQNIRAGHTRLRIALAAYNTGMGGALEGYRADDIDMNTTGKDYSRDVLRRMMFVHEWLNRHPNWR